jgi:signal transduction histidine kinase/CheY-like chemotaxis protein
MFTSVQYAKTVDSSFSSSVNDLFQSTSRSLIFTVGICYLIFLMSAAVWPKQIATNAWIIVPISMLMFWFALWLLPRVYLLAHLILQIGLAGSITLAIYLFQKPEIAFFYALMPLVSVVCLGWKTGTIMQFVNLGMLYWINHGLLMIPPSLTLSIIVMTGSLMSEMLGWASMQAVLTVTQWSLYHFQQSQKNLSEARDHQAKLAHVVKELDSANIRLDRMNRLLVLARSEAEEAKDARNRFALSISHELRTPLNFIISFSEIMIKTPATYAPLNRWPANLYEDVQEIYRSSKHLMRLVNDVLDLGQIENMRMNLLKEWISLAQVVSEVTGMMQRAFDLKKVELRVDIAPDLPLVYVDHTRIRQVLLNLVNNSLRFTDQGAVTIRLRRHSDEQLLIVVEDTGTGIAQDDLPRIFEEFGQVSKDSWRRREGAGLGIPISKRFIELHRGQMWVESEVGQGTKFFITLPIPPASNLTSVIDQEREDQYWLQMKNKAEKGKNILVISSDPSAAEIIAPFIDGFILVGIPREDDYRARASSLLPYSIFLDKAIVDDVDVVRKLNQLPYDLPIISFTFPGNGSLPRNLPECVRHYLVKPVSNQALVEAILSLGENVHNLLVVDDDPAMTTLIVRALQSQLGADPIHLYQVSAASNGVEALETIQMNKPDAILLDISLPDISGLDLLDVAQKNQIQVIFLTAYEWPQESPETETDALRVQMHRPLNRNELPNLLKNLLEVVRPRYPADLSGLIH